MIITWQGSPLVNPGFCHTNRFHGNGHKPCIFVRESRAIQKKEVWSMCHIINYLLASSARALLGSISSFFCCCCSLLFHFFRFLFFVLFWVEGRLIEVEH